MNQSINKQQIRIAYVLFGITLLILHCFLITGTNDDAWFAKILDDYNLVDYLIMRYQTWTSRLPIEALVVILARINPWIWKIFNVIILVLLVYECVTVWGKIKNVFTVGSFMMLIFLLPPQILSSAGWIATTVNYLWAITIGIYTLIPLCKWFRGEKICRHEYIVGCIACVFGCSQEQMAAVLFVVYILITSYCICFLKRRIPLFLWMYCIISSVILLYILFCPGNATRSILEKQTWFPEFSVLSFNEKILIGYLTTFSYYVSCKDFNVIFLMFSFVLALAVFNTTSKYSLRCLGVYPFFVTMCWGFGGRIIISKNITSRIYWLGLIQNDKIGEASIYSGGHIVVECFVFFSVLCSVLLSLFIVFFKELAFFVSVIILFAALCSRIVIGLSPTVYASGTRTATLGCICFLILTFICIQRCISGRNVKRYVISYILFYIALLMINILVGM